MGYEQNHRPSPPRPRRKGSDSRHRRGATVKGGAQCPVLGRGGSRALPSLWPTAKLGSPLQLARG